MNPAILNSPFAQVALPIMVTLVTTITIAQWSQNKRFDDLNKRLDDLRSDINQRFDAANKRIDEVIKRLDRIDETIKTYGVKIAALEERTSPLARRG